MPQNYLDQLSEFVAELRWEDLHPSTIAAAKDVALDTAGAMIAGSRLDENANFARLAANLSGPGNSTVVGHPHRVQPVWATMVNATAGVSLEMDEGSRIGGGHPSIHVTPGSHRGRRRFGSQRSRRAGEHYRWLRGHLPHRQRDPNSSPKSTPMAPGAPSVRRQPPPA